MVESAGLVQFLKQWKETSYLPKFARDKQQPFWEETVILENKPALLKVIANIWVVHISQPSLGNAFHGLEQKRLVLGVNILNALQQVGK